MTYRAIYHEGVKMLEQAGIAEAGLDARLLLEYLCGTDRNTLLLHGEREVTDQEIRDYRTLIKTRAERYPLQYLTGEQDFMGLTFHVDENVLIPRQDTELLVEEIMKDGHDGKRILEIGSFLAGMTAPPILMQPKSWSLTALLWAKKLQARANTRLRTTR